MSHPDILGDYCEPIKLAPSQVRAVPIDHTPTPAERREIDAILKLFAKSKHPCAQPTLLKPGSKDKIALMNERYKLHLPVQHPYDRQLGDADDE